MHLELTNVCGGISSPLESSSSLTVLPDLRMFKSRKNTSRVMYLLTRLCIYLICTSAGTLFLFELNNLYVNNSTLMIMIIMIYHILFSILVKEALSKFRRLSPESAWQMICFSQHSSERGTFCLCDTHLRFTKS